jgi:hypothetical protein
MNAVDQFAVHVGLDWADKKHDVCVQFKNGERTFHVINHTPEALDNRLNELHLKFKGRIAIALELKKGPVVYALQKYPLLLSFLYTRYHWPAIGRPSARVVRKMILIMPSWRWI